MLTMGFARAAGRRLGAATPAASSTTRCGSPAPWSSTRATARSSRSSPRSAQLDGCARARIDLTVKLGERDRARQGAGARRARLTGARHPVLRTHDPAGRRAGRAPRDRDDAARPRRPRPRGLGGREPWLALGGGSNLLVGDDGLRRHRHPRRDEGHRGARARRRERRRDASRAYATRRRTTGRRASVRLRVQAGETWDDLVAWTVEQRLLGLRGALAASPDRSVRRRCRTSAPTARSSSVDARRDRVPRRGRRRARAA